MKIGTDESNKIKVCRANNSENKAEAKHAEGAAANPSDFSTILVEGGTEDKIQGDILAQDKSTVTFFGYIEKPVIPRSS